MTGVPKCSDNMDASSRTTPWKTAKLGEVCSLITRGISPKYLESGGICVLNQRCIRNHAIDWAAARRHDDQTKRVSPDRLLQIGDGLINSTGTGTLGRVAQVTDLPDEPATVDSHVTIVRPAPGLFFLRFFEYMLIEIEDQLQNSGEGCGGQTELARSAVAGKFTVRFPSSLREQERIVTILDAATEGICRAKASANVNQSRASSLLAQELTRLLTGGKNTWISLPLGSVVTFIDYRGRTPEKTTDGLPLITAKNVRMGYLKDEPREFVAEKSYEGWMTRGIPKKGDVLFTTEAPLANVAQLDTSDRVVFAQRIIIMQANPEKLDSTFLKFLLLSPPYSETHTR